jgi:hypothetical protein
VAIALPAALSSSPANQFSTYLNDWSANATRVTGVDAKTVAINKIYDILRTTCRVLPIETTYSRSWYQAELSALTSKVPNQEAGFQVKIVDLEKQRQLTVGISLKALKPFVSAAQFQQIQQDQNFSVR